MANPSPPMRLQKFLAQAGAGSRRSCEALITEGRVRVNGKKCITLGTCIDPERDLIELDGQKMLLPEQRYYLMLNKPEGYLVSRSDPHQSKTIYLLLPPECAILHPVGRLDQNSCGLLLLTNDGQLTEKLLHPRFKMEKVYRVQVRGKVSETALKYLREGVDLSDGRTQPAQITRLRPRGEHSWLEFRLKEGRNRQIRRMCRAVGLEVVSLQRIAFGPLQLGGLPEGAWRELMSEELRALQNKALTHAATAAPKRDQTRPEKQHNTQKISDKRPASPRRKTTRP
jgi:23S rRNA pseudouridine2605 synthase